MSFNQAFFDVLENPRKVSPLLMDPFSFNTTPQAPETLFPEQGLFSENQQPKRFDSADREKKKDIANPFLLD